MDRTSRVGPDYGLCRCALHIVIFPYPFSKVSGSLPQNDSFILTFEKVALRCCTFEAFKLWQGNSSPPIMREFKRFVGFHPYFWNGARSKMKMFNQSCDWFEVPLLGHDCGYFGWHTFFSQPILSRNPSYWYMWYWSQKWGLASYLCNVHADI